MQVRLAADFFRKERNQAYRNWRSALWRELVQNAVDAKCTQITVEIVAKGDGFTLHFADNGPRMSREVLESVYFAVGATSKSGGDSIGGMGRARMLTCFAMNSYRIRSQDYIVNGSGGEYQVASAPHIGGCALDIDVDNYPVDLAMQYLRQFLAQSSIRPALTINGCRYDPTPIVRGRHVRNLVSDEKTFAHVFVNKSARERRVLVRINGVTMFSQSATFEGQVIVELLPETSRAVLTSNRDGLRGDYSDVLNGFLAELSTNTKSALRGAVQRRTTKANRGGALRVRRPPGTTIEAGDRQPEAALVASSPPPLTSMPIMPELTVDSDLVMRSSGGGCVIENWIAMTFGDVYLTDETNNRKMRRAMPAYLPQRWTMAVHRRTGRPTMRGGTIVKLLLCWKVCVTYALEILCEHTGDYDRAYSLGFLFDDEGSLATHRKTTEGSVFSLAPVDADGRIKYSVTRRADLLRLMSIAKHETTHVLHSWHNEAFTTTREQIDFAFDASECFRRIKQALRTMPF